MYLAKCIDDDKTYPIDPESIREEKVVKTRGFNYGAGNSERLHSAFRYGTVLVTGMMILGTLAVLLFPAQILGLFMASEAMRSFGISAMRIMAASYLFCGLSTMISTYFQTTEKVGSSIAIQVHQEPICESYTSS